VSDGIRTRDSQIHSLETACPNPLPDTTCGDGEPRRSRACITLDTIEPDLRRVVDAWAELADNLKAAVLAMIGDPRK